jgi:hypothetical protein
LREKERNIWHKFFHSKSEFIPHNNVCLCHAPAAAAAAAASGVLAGSTATFRNRVRVPVCFLGLSAQDIIEHASGQEADTQPEKRAFQSQEKIETIGESKR